MAELKDVYVDGTKMVDYIVESKTDVTSTTSSQWNYRRYASGYVELYKEFLITNTFPNAVPNTGYYGTTDISSGQLPFNIPNPVVTLTVRSNMSIDNDYHARVRYVSQLAGPNGPVQFIYFTVYQSKTSPPSMQPIVSMVVRGMIVD